MKIKTLSFAIGLSLSCFTLYASDTTDVSSENTLIQSQLMSKDVGVQSVPFPIGQLVTTIMSKAKSAIGGQLWSLLEDAIFGPGGPQFVMLHEQALQQIEDRVNKVVVTGYVEEAISDMMSFRDLLSYYHASVSNNNPDYGILDNLVIYATSMKNHQAYRESYNPEAYLLTVSYSLVASLTMATITEKELQGQVSHSFTQSMASSLYSKLSQLGAQADSYIRQNVYVRLNGDDCDLYLSHGQLQLQSTLLDDELMSQPKPTIENEASFAGMCRYTTFDLIDGKSRSWKLGIYGAEEAADFAYGLEASLTKEYKDVIKGSDYNAFMAELSSF